MATSPSLLELPENFEFAVGQTRHELVNSSLMNKTT